MKRNEQKSRELPFVLSRIFFQSILCIQERFSFTRIDWCRTFTVRVDQRDDWFCNRFYKSILEKRIRASLDWLQMKMKDLEGLRPSHFCLCSDSHWFYQIKCTHSQGFIGRGVERELSRAILTGSFVAFSRSLGIHSQWEELRSCRLRFLIGGSMEKYLEQNCRRECILSLNKAIYFEMGDWRVASAQRMSTSVELHRETLGYEASVLGSRQDEFWSTVIE